MHIHYSFSLIALTSIIWLFGCEQAKDLHDHPKLTTGKQLFEHHCSDCHKQDGSGNFRLGVPANNDITLSKNQIQHKIIKGAQKTSMPSFPNMPTAEAEKIAKYVLTL